MLVFIQLGSHCFLQEQSLEPVGYLCGDVQLVVYLLMR